MSTNLTFCNCKEWQDFMNNDMSIRMGQPVIKADKASALLPIEQRCELVTEAQPKVKGYAKSRNRLYLPLGVEQIAMFMIKKGYNLICYFEDTNTIIRLSTKTGRYEVTGKDWYEASGKLINNMKAKGDVA